MQPPREPDIEGRSLEGGRLAHVTVPAHAGQSMDASRRYVANARRLLVGQADAQRCGWVVDLRPNGGGNMWPMLAALAPLLGSDTLGAFVSHGSATRWTSAGAQDDGGAMREYAVGAPGATLDLRAFPVAVLTGPRTASSGEAVTLAFRGRPFTRSFGAPTAGVSTANAPFPLPGGGLLNLTTARMADRTGRIFGDAIEPDEAVPDDAALDAATRWLLAQSRCGAL